LPVLAPVIPDVADVHTTGIRGDADSIGISETICHDFGPGPLAADKRIVGRHTAIGADTEDFAEQAGEVLRTVGGIVEEPGCFLREIIIPCRDVQAAILRVEKEPSALPLSVLCTGDVEENAFRFRADAP